MPTCPCESGKPYSQCCEVYHAGNPAPTAEALMRSRYSAYALGLEDYLLKTWHPDTRPKTLDLAEDGSTKWLGLQVKRAGTTGNNSATVEFIARYRIGGGKAERMHEISQFLRIGTQWLYLSGEHIN